MSVASASKTKRPSKERMIEFKESIKGAPKMSPDDIICVCADLTLGQMYDSIAENGFGFQEMLDATESGNVCTACLLNMEYQFAQIPADVYRSGTTKSKHAKRQVRRSLKRWLFDAIDFISPKVSFYLSNSAMVIRGRAVEQYLIIANDSRFFLDKEVAPTVNIKVVVTDETGKIQHSKVYKACANEQFLLKVSDFIPESESASELSCGHLNVTRWFDDVGFRGTTRPQIMLIGDAGAGGVHTQATRGPIENWFSCLYQPDGEILFIGFSNESQKTLDLSIACYGLNTDIDAPLEVYEVEVEPGHSLLHKVVVKSENRDALINDVMRLRIVSKKPGKRTLCLMSSSKNLDRISMDHPTG